MADLVAHLVTKGIVDFLSMDNAVQQMHRIGGRLASNILETSKVQPDLLMEAIADYYEMDYAPASLLATVDPDVVQFWRLDTALRLGAIPLALNTQGLTLGVLEPLSHMELLEVQEEYGSKITQLLMFEFRFFEMCNRFFGVVLDQRYARWVSKYPIDSYRHPPLPEDEPDHPRARRDHEQTAENEPTSSRDTLTAETDPLAQDGAEVPDLSHASVSEGDDASVLAADLLLMDHDGFEDLFVAPSDATVNDRHEGEARPDVTPPSGVKHLANVHQEESFPHDTMVASSASPSSKTSSSGTFRFDGGLRQEKLTTPPVAPDLAYRLGLCDEDGSWLAMHNTLDRLSDEERSYSTKITTIDIRTFYQQARYIEDFLYPTLSYFHPFFKRRFLMHFWQPYKTTGLLMQGVREHDVPFTRVEVPYDDNSAVNKMRTTGNFLRGTPVDIGFLTLYSRIGIPKAKETIVMPIRIEGQVVMVLILDQGPDLPIGDTLHPGEINLILQQLGQALTVFARSPKKDRYLSPSPSATDEPEPVDALDLVPKELLAQAGIPAAEDDRLEAAMDSMQLDPVEDAEYLTQGEEDLLGDAQEDAELSEAARALIDQDTRHNDHRAVSIILGDDERSDADIALDLIPHTSSDLIRIEQPGESSATSSTRSPRRSVKTSKTSIPTITAKHERFVPVHGDEISEPSANPGRNEATNERITTESAPHILQDPIERELHDILQAEKSTAQEQAPHEEEPSSAKDASTQDPIPNANEPDEPSSSDGDAHASVNERATSSESKNIFQDLASPSTADVSSDYVTTSTTDAAPTAPDANILPAGAFLSPASATTTTSQSSRAPAATAQWNAQDLARLLRLASTISPIPKPSTSPTEQVEAEPDTAPSEPDITPQPLPATDDPAHPDVAPSVAAPTPNEPQPNAPTPEDEATDDDIEETLLVSPKKLVIPDILRSRNAPQSARNQVVPTNEVATDPSLETSEEDEGPNETLHLSPRDWQQTTVADPDPAQKRSVTPSAASKVDTAPHHPSSMHTEARATGTAKNQAPSSAWRTEKRKQQDPAPEPSEPSWANRREGSTKPLTIAPPVDLDATLFEGESTTLDAIMEEVENAQSIDALADQIATERDPIAPHDMVAEETSAPKIPTVPPPPPAPASTPSTNEKIVEPSPAAPDVPTPHVAQQHVTTAEVDQVPIWTQLFSDDEHIHAQAFTKLLQASQTALPDLRNVFPGPVHIDRKDKELAFAPIGKHGPLLALVDARLYDFVPQLWDIIRIGDSHARYYALRHLALIRTLSTQYKLLVTCAVDPDEQVRQLALELIDSFRQRPEFHAAISSFQDLLEQTHDTETQVRAIEALTTLHNEASIPRIMAMLDNDNYALRTAAHQSLMHLTCIDVGTHKDAWVQWYKLHGHDEPGEWLVSAMDAIDPVRRALAQRALTNIRGLIVNYHPDMNSTGLRRARMTVERYFGLRR